jgi:hypothetical protein
MLKNPTAQLPARVLSKDKKTNEAVHRHHFKKQIAR